MKILVTTYFHKFSFLPKKVTKLIFCNDVTLTSKMADYLIPKIKCHSKHAKNYILNEVFVAHPTITILRFDRCWKCCRKSWLISSQVKMMTVLETITLIIIIFALFEVHAMLFCVALRSLKIKVSDETA